MAAKKATRKTTAKKTARKSTAKKTTRRRKVSEDTKKDLEEGAPAGTADVEIKPVESTVSGKKPKPAVDKAEEIQNKKDETPVVSSVAQLRETAKAQGKTVSTEQVAEARKVEEDIAKKGGELHRPSAANR